MHCVSSILAAALALIAAPGLSMGQTHIVAHRGNSSEAPENTLAAVVSAANLDPPPAYIEIDLHASLDGELVVCHDANALRTAGVDAVIREKPHSWLRGLDAGYPEKFGDRFPNEPLPTLEEVLDAVRDKPIGIMIECKQLLLEGRVIDLLRKRGELDKHVLASFDELTVYRSKMIEPRLRTLYLAGGYSPETIGRLGDVDADIFGIQHSNQPPSIMKDARARGIEVWVWTVDEDERIEAWLGSGVDGLITNRPRRALEIQGLMDSGRESAPAH